MRLLAAARKFNNTPCLDAYTGDLAFYGQFALYDDNKRDSETAERRVLSVEDGTEVPARRVVEAAGSRWILGHANPDTFKGEIIRVGLVAHEATYLSSVRTLAQVCLGEPGVTAWCGRAWIKNAAFTEQSSNLAPLYNLHFASTEQVAEESVVSFEGDLLIARVTHSGPSGTLIVLGERMPAPAVETVTIDGSIYDPVNETWTGGTVSAQAVRARWQSLFKYRSSAAPSFGPEDIQVAFAKVVMTAKPGMKVTMSDGIWHIADAHDEGDVWLCRAVQHV